MRIVYLAGSGRSGSTVVAQWLEQRSRGVHVGELRYVWDRGVAANHLCECGRPFDSCPFWTDVMHRAYGSDVAGAAERMRNLSPVVDRIRRIPQAVTGIGTGYRQALAEFGDVLVPLYRAVAEVGDTDLVIDSSKDPSYLYALGAIPALEVAPLHLVRDSRAVAYSWTRRRRRPEIHWREEYMRTVTPRRSALLWLEYNTAVDLCTARSQRAARLRYEDFAADPDAAVTGLPARLGLDVTVADRTRPAGHSLSGNPMRFGRGPLTVRIDDEWERALPAADRRRVTAITAPLLRRYGYRLARRAAHPVHLCPD